MVASPNLEVSPMVFRDLVLASVAWVALLVSGLQAQAFTVTFSKNRFKINLPIQRFSGHEELTRQSLNIAERKLLTLGISIPEDVDMFLGDRKNRILGLGGDTTANMIIQGNYANDFPQGITIPAAKVVNGVVVDSVPAWWGGSFDGWDTRGDIQTLHFLMDVNDSNDGFRYSQRGNCETTRNKIMINTKEAVASWERAEAYRHAGFKYEKYRVEETRRAMFFLGAASHTIQDSFSPSHTMRGSRSDNYDITNICYYGKDLREKLGDHANDLCYHHTVDTRDGIWIRTDHQLAFARENWDGEAMPSEQCTPKFLTLPLRESAKASCLKHEARLARHATIRYFVLIARYLRDRRSHQGGYAMAGGDPNLTELDRRMILEFFYGNTGYSADESDERIPKTWGASVKQKIKEVLGLGVPAYMVADAEYMPYGVMRCETITGKNVGPFAVPTQQEIDSELGDDAQHGTDRKGAEQ